ncbi:MAG: hypothetical protein ACOYI3_03600 [Christensenellales bacterium]|jgi:hypothetical protein
MKSRKKTWTLWGLVILLSVMLPANALAGVTMPPVPPEGGYAAQGVIDDSSGDTPPGSTPAVTQTAETPTTTEATPEAASEEAESTPDAPPAEAETTPEELPEEADVPAEEEPVSDTELPDEVPEELPDTGEGESLWVWWLSLSLLAAGLATAFVMRRSAG